jgi:hypothetical protein
MPVILKNNAYGFLVQDISDTANAIVVQSGQGSNFPSLSAGQYFYATIQSIAGVAEIVRVTARNGDAMSIVRAQEGTIAISFSAGARVELRVTAQSVVDAIDDRVGLYDQASEISFVPTGGISATDVQAALAEVDTEKVAFTRLDDSDGSSLVGFIQAGTSAVATTVETKLRESVSIKDFGAVGDGVTNDRAAIQAALNTGKSVLIPSGTYLFSTSISFTAANQCIFGLGNDSILKSGPGSVYIQSQGLNNLTIRDLQIDGVGTNGGILISNNSSNFDVLNIFFNGGGQRVWLWDCDHIAVQNCTFDNTGYGVIAQAGRSPNYVLVDGNIAKNMQNDFVEANTASAPAEFWTISNNIFTGSASYPTPKTEERFVGITNVRGVIITGNLVRNSAGDAPVHLEDLLGETVISNNIFDNCIGSGGNLGYIYLLNSAEDVIINANIFLRTDASLPVAYAVDVSSANYSNSFIFSNNRVVGVAAGGNFNGINYLFNSGYTLVSGNVFQNLNNAIAHQSSSNLVVSDNIFGNCANGINLVPNPSAIAGFDFAVLGNVFRNTTGTYDILAVTNSNGTGAPKRWSVQNNVFTKQVSISGLPGGAGGSVSDAEDITISNNVFGATATLTVGGTMSRRVRFNNVFRDPTAGGGTTLIQDLRNYADDTAAATGDIPVGGLYRNGSVLQVRIT